ncbi:hypothetical protein GI374_04405 [Paracoccus sp. S-4012]|uniref:hypothetical protein n=1 Tax=Paracoccus sp. S-4012 TaxID=2665648 RepID=UPI0012B090E2|nr:hypothetical protein [Paracoccus sp. S-4012]MRX49701.1 hypothetical protein [Paracoccus sp. S-4012]
MAGRLFSVAALALLAVASPAGADEAALAAFIAEADRWLYAGERAPADLPIRLRRLPPAERLLAIAYLRRTGLFDGPAFDPALTLAPAEAPR